MLETLVLTLRPAAAAATLLAAAAYLLPLLGRRALAAASAAALAASGLLALLVERGVWARESVDGVSILLATTGMAVFVFVALLARRRRMARLLGWVAASGLSLALLPWGTDLLLRALRTWTDADPLQGPPWPSLAGVLAALLVAGLFTVMLRRARTAETELADRWSQAHGTGTGLGLATAAGLVLVLAALFVEQLLVLLQIGFAYGYLPLTTATLEVAAPLLNARGGLFYLLPVGWLLVSGSRLWRSSSRVGRAMKRIPFRNPAEARLHRASRRRYRTLTLAAAGGAALMVTLVAGHGVLQLNAAKATLSPAQPVTAQDGVVTLSTAGLPQGQLVRFAYEAGDGTEVRFLAVNKGSGIYSLALDACNICGPTGYSTRDGDIVCRACDVAINIPTIGFPGGCNPIPLQAESADGELRVRAADLERETRKFW